MLLNLHVGALLCLQNCAAIISSVANPTTGVCECSVAPFTIPATDNGQLKQCLSSNTVAGGCPPGFPIGAKTSSNTPTIVQCITVGSACPAGFTLPLYNGAARVECRPNIGCVYTNYGTKITNGTSDDPIGCLIDGATECPFVAFRSASNNFKIDFCRDVASCPTTTSHTVPAQSSTAVVPRACLTLGSPTQACPDIPGLSFPLEVVDAKPNQPCGSATLLCTDTRVVRCLPAASTCPLGFGLQLFKNPNGPASTPELVECRCADYQLS